MKNNRRLTLTCLTFLVILANTAYSVPNIETGAGGESVIAGDTQGQTATGEKSSAFGIGNTADGKYSSAFGYRNMTKEEYSAAFGTNNKAEGNKSSAFGVINEVKGKNSTVIGTEYKVTGNSSGAFGVGSYNGAYQYTNEGNDSYMIGNKNKIAKDSNNNFILGNEVSIGEKIQNSVALGNKSTVSRSNEVSVGSKNNERKITNVADGEISANSTDAITGKQLFNAMHSKDDFKNEVNKKIDDVKGDIRNVGSLSAALAGLHPMQYDPKVPTQIMASVGHYKNKQSVAVGASYHFNDRFMMSTGIALSGDKKAKSMANVGFTLKLGKGSAYGESSQFVAPNEVNKLTIENQNLKTEINFLNLKTKEQDEKIKKLEEKLNDLLKINSI